MKKSPGKVPYTITAAVEEISSWIPRRIRGRKSIQIGLRLDSDNVHQSNAITLGVISCSPNRFRMEKRHVIGLELGFELSSMVWDDGEGFPKTSNPSAKDALCHSFCCDVRAGMASGQRVIKVIHTCKKIG